MKQVVVHKGRTVIVQVSLGYDVSGDSFKSEIRVAQSRTSELIAEWDISFHTDGADGEILLTLDDSVTNGITQTTGYMDLKRITSGKPVNVFDEVLEVVFKETVTV